MTIPSTGRHARYFVEYEFKTDGSYRSTDYTVYDDGTLVEGSRAYCLNEGTCRVANDRIYYTAKGSGEQVLMRIIPAFCDPVGEHKQHS